MPPEPVATVTPPRPAGPPRLSLAPAPALRVVDVALFYGERSGGIRTYLDAKRVWGPADHVVVTPHDVPSLRFATPNGYKIPLGVGALKARLRELRPDVVLLHDPFWAPLGVTRVTHELGARVVAVHHGSVDLDSAGIPLPGRFVRPALRAWFRHAYRDADAIMSAVPTLADTGRHATLQLRFGLDEAFHPRPEVRRGDEVVYVGRLAREKGVLELVDAAALAREPWTLRFVGSGPLGESLRARVRARGIADRVAFAPFISDRAELSRTYAGACVVVMPGAHETFGLVGFEAAASGARLVCCDTAPSAQFVGELAHTYRPGDVPGLARAIEAARCAGADAGAAWRIVERNSWPAAFAAEQAALAELCGGRRVG